MPFNGIGTYQLPSPENPVIPGSTILASDFNTTMDDLADALSLCLPRDGQSAMLAALPMGGFKITGMANGVNPQDATTVLQVFTNPTFNGTDTDGVTVTGTALTVTATAVTLPASTVVGDVSDTELQYLNGVTSAVQTQIDAKGAHAGQVWTGTHDFTGATVTVATQASSNNSTSAASTAFVQAVAFNAELPAQAGNSGKFVTTDGTNASWASPFPAQAGNADKVLKTDGTNVSWTARLPAQAGNSGKVLTTNGTTESWELGLPAQGGESGKFLGTNGTSPAWQTVYINPLPMFTLGLI